MNLFTIIHTIFTSICFGLAWYWRKQRNDARKQLPENAARAAFLQSKREQLTHSLMVIGVGDSCSNLAADIVWIYADELLETEAERTRRKNEQPWSPELLAEFAELDAKKAANQQANIIANKAAK